MSQINNKKNRKQSESRLVHNKLVRQVGINKMKFALDGIHNYLTSRGAASRGSSNGLLLSVSDRLSLLNSRDREDYNSFRKGFVSNIFQDQIVRMKARSAPASITTSVGGILTSVVQMAFSGLANASDFTAVFDEVRFLQPMEFCYYSELAPNGTSSTKNLGIGVVDYDDASALASINGALAYDTAKVVQLAPVGDEADAYQNACKWHGKLMGIPDQVWNTTTAYTTVVAWLKFYNLTGSLTSSTTYGYVIYTNELEFRQVN